MYKNLQGRFNNNGDSRGGYGGGGGSKHYYNKHSRFQSPPTGPRAYYNRQSLDPSNGNNTLDRNNAMDLPPDYGTKSLLYPMSLEEQLRTIFIGDIPEGMPDSLIQTALKHIPGLEYYLPLKLPNKSSARFGFARYTSQSSVKAALDVLPRVQLGNKENEHRLTAVCEENTRRWLASSAESGTNVSNEELQRLITETLSIWDGNSIDKSRVQSSAPAPAEDDKEESVEDLYKNSLRVESKDELTEIPEEYRETMMEEIKAFRTLSLKIEKDRRAAEEEYEKERQEKIAEASAKALSEKKYDSTTNNDQVFGNKLKLAEDDYDEKINDESENPDIEDEYLEAQRDRRRKERLDRRFADRERRWEAREATRASALEREKLRDENMDAKLQKDREAVLKRYAALSKNSDHALKNMLYYTDHATWVKERMAFRRREIEEDKRDARAEEEEQRQNPSNLVNASSSSNKISLTLSKKSESQPVESTLTVEQPVSSAALPSTTVPSHLFDTEEEENTKAREPPSSMKSRMALVDEIPDDKENLFAWKVKWDSLDQETIQDKIRPLVVSNIIEYLGVQEEELISFVLTHLSEHKSPEDLVSELEMTLDEDAEVFTTQLWKTLVYETEVKYRNINQ